MINNKSQNDLKIGQFLVANGIITKKDLAAALKLQLDNQERLIGEILVTQGLLEKEDLIMAFEMFLIETDSAATHANEWLDQDEIDILLDKIKNDKKNK